MSVPNGPQVKTALVTGVAGTMGKAATQGLSADGVRVAMADINLEALEKARNELIEGAPQIPSPASESGYFLTQQLFCSMHKGIRDGTVTN